MEGESASNSKAASNKRENPKKISIRTTAGERLRLLDRALTPEWLPDPGFPSTKGSTCFSQPAWASGTCGSLLPISGIVAGRGDAKTPLSIGISLADTSSSSRQQPGAYVDSWYSLPPNSVPLPNGQPEADNLILGKGAPVS